jgi:hypothetical protein
MATNQVGGNKSSGKLQQANVKKILNGRTNFKSCILLFISFIDVLNNFQPELPQTNSLQAPPPKMNRS